MRKQSANTTSSIARSLSFLILTPRSDALQMRVLTGSKLMSWLPKRDIGVNEKVRVLEYLCTMLAPHYAGETPGWHGDVLRETEARVAAGEDRFMSLEESKRLFGEMAHAH